MNIRITKNQKYIQAEILIFDEDSPKEKKVILREESIPKLLIKLQDELMAHFKPKS